MSLESQLHSPCGVTTQDGKVVCRRSRIDCPMQHKINEANDPGTSPQGREIIKSFIQRSCNGTPRRES